MSCELTIGKILVPIDFSENSLAGLRHALLMAESFDAEIELVHVVESSPYVVYQQRGFLRQVPLYAQNDSFPPSANPRFIIEDVMMETAKQLQGLADTQSTGVARPCGGEAAGRAGKLQT